MVLDLLRNDNTISETDHPEVCQIKDGGIEFRNVWFTYDKEKLPHEQKHVLKGASFKVEPGSSVGIVGPTGAGKSTIMRLLYRFYDLTLSQKGDNGQIFIDGQDIAQLKIRDLRKKIAIVPQDCVLFNETAAYNISYGALGLIDYFQPQTYSQSLIDQLRHI